MVGGGSRWGVVSYRRLMMHHHGLLLHHGLHGHGICLLLWQRHAVVVWLGRLLVLLWPQGVVVASAASMLSKNLSTMGCHEPVEPP